MKVIDPTLNFPAIYIIETKNGSRRYVGSAINLFKRWHIHRGDLRAGRHHSKFLQRAWIKHGESAFDFVLVERLPNDVTKKELTAREQYWLDALQPCFNTCLVAYSPLGVKRSKETRAKMAANKAKLHRFMSPDGQIVEIHDLKRFCLERGLNQGHMAGVHNGRKGEYKGWRAADTVFVPKPTNVPTKMWRFISPEGELFQTIGVVELCQRFDLDATAMSKIHSGIGNHHKGWIKFIEPPDASMDLAEWCRDFSERQRNKPRVLQYREGRGPGRPGDYVFLSPDGSRVEVSNLTAFCRENGLGQPSMCKVGNGKQPQHKGWRRYTEEAPTIQLAAE